MLFGTILTTAKTTPLNFGLSEKRVRNAPWNEKRAINTSTTKNEEEKKFAISKKKRNFAIRYNNTKII